MPLDRADLGDDSEPGHDAPLMGLGVAGLGKPDPTHLTVRRLGAEERNPCRVGSPAGEAREHFEEDPPNRLRLVALGQVPGDPAHAATPPRVEA